MAANMGVVPISIRLIASVDGREVSEIGTGTIDLELTASTVGDLELKTASGATAAKVLVEAPEMRGQIAAALREMADGLDPVGKHIAQSIEVTETGDVLVEGKSFPLYLTREPIVASVAPGGFTTVRLPIAVEHFVAATPTSPSDAPAPSEAPGVDLIASQQ